MDKNPAEVLVVFFNPVVELLYVRLSEKAQNTLFQLARAFARNDFNEGNLFCYSFSYDPVELSVDAPAFIKYVVEIENKF